MSDAPDTSAVMASLYTDRRDRSRRLRRTVGFCVGLALLAAAVWAVVSNAQPMREAISKVSSGAWWLLPVLIALPFGHIPLTGAVFWAATPAGPDGRPRVGMREMTALIATGNLANYLPLRPGMVARIAYHRAVNGISVIESAKILGSVVACGLLAAGLFLIAAMTAVRVSGGSVPWLPWLVLALPPVVGVLGAWHARSGAVEGSTPQASTLWRWWAVTTLRYVDLALWALRYAVAFWVIGLPLTPAQAAVYAVVANAAMLIPIAGNGLGIREWVVGLAGHLLPVAVLGVSAGVGEGVSADLLNRAGEIVMSIIAGTIGGAWVTRELKRRTSDRAQDRRVDP